MNHEQLFANILSKKSFLCVGLDPDMLKIPPHVKERRDPIFEFNKEIISMTAPYVVAYKLNTAFYEAYGVHGWQQLQMTVEFIKSQYPDIFIIADAKRGDIGNTAKMYAKAFFENMDCDAVTLAPYMGSDSIKPFLEYPGKWAIILAITSNSSATDFETLSVGSPRDKNECGNIDSSEMGQMPLYEKVISETMKLGSMDNIMYVIGATRPQKLKEIRKYVPDNFFLVPGVGAQGGTIEEVVKNGINSRCGLLINSSRDIIYASSGTDYASMACIRAKELATDMRCALEDYDLL